MSVVIHPSFSWSLGTVRTAGVTRHVMRHVKSSVASRVTSSVASRVTSSVTSCITSCVEAPTRSAASSDLDVTQLAANLQVIDQVRIVRVRVVPASEL